MARLGSILGAILAELGRARVVADRLSRDLVAEYRADPVLASMSVPRVLLDQAELTLHFSVSDFQEQAARAPSATVTSAAWSRHVAAVVMPQLLGRHGIAGGEREAVMQRVPGTPDSPALRVPPAAIREALAGKTSSVVKATVGSLLEAWSRLPREARAKLGPKAAFQRELEVLLSLEADSFISRLSELELVKAALASQIAVGIRSDELPSDPVRIQELKLTLRGDDVTLIVEGAGEV